MTKDDLIAALEAADGPSRELDRAIGRLVMEPAEIEFNRVHDEWPRYTALIDAYLPGENIVRMLKNEKGFWCHDAGEPVYGGTHRTSEAIARRIAALKARA